MKKRFAFNIPKAIAAAWDAHWAANLRRRAEDDEYEKKVGKKAYDWARTYYLCAADIELTVRDYAANTLKGEPWGTNPGCGSYSGIKMPGGLNNMVRDWLRTNPKITGHNFGRGHISGMRFRPVGEPMAEAELQTIENKKKRREGLTPVHAIGNRGGCLCLDSRKKRSIWGRSRYSQARITRDEEKVNCPRCKKLLLQLDAARCADVSGTP